VLTVCCIGQGMVVLDVSVVNVALPSIRRALDFDPTGLAWVVNAYTLVFAGFLLLGGRLVDIVDPRRVLLGAFGLFTLASLLGGLAPTATWLVIARALQGLGAAALAPVTLSILNTTFAEPAARRRALGIWGAVSAGGGAVGMLAGGVLTELVSWRAILAINVPIGVLTMLVALRVLSAGRPARQRFRLDVAGALTVSAGLVAVVFGLIQAEPHGWSSPVTWGPMVGGVGLLGLFVLVETRLATAPLLPPGMFRVPGVAGGNVAVVLLGFVLLPMYYFVTLYVQQVLGYSPIAAGLAFIPMAVLLAVCSRAAGRLVQRIGPRLTAAVGLLVTAGGMALFGRAPVHGHYLTDVLPPSVAVAAGIGLSFFALTYAATEHVPAESAGLAAGLVNTTRQVGGGIGLAALASLAQSRTDAAVGHHADHLTALATGYHTAFLVAAVAAVVAAAVTAAQYRR
jgi:EmrB/QacA subfamily drug resistance transporter